MKWALTLGIAFLLIIITSESSGETVIVDDDDGSWADYSSIQDAINESNDGDTIRVFGGTYSEALTVIKQLAIIGNESEYATIDGLGNEMIINITADNCSMAYFRIGNGSAWGDGISIQANHTNIYNVSLFDVHRAILVSQSINCTIDNIILIDGNVAAEVILSDLITIQNGIFITGNGVVATLSKEIIFHNLTFGDGYNGVKTYFCINASISKITVNRCKWGIEIDSSFRITISDSFIGYNGNAGIVIADSENISVVDNIIPFNGYGILLSSSVECNIQDNEFAGCGILINGDYLEEWNTHDIGLTNTVNDKPLRYLKNVNDTIVSSDAGQVILANCYYITVKDINVSHCSVGIQLGYSDYCTISTNTCNGSIYGIALVWSWDNIIENNSLKNGFYGVNLYMSDYNIIQFNNIFENSGYSIQIEEDCEDNWVFHNNISSNHNIPQALDDGINNTWYRNGIGNYWSDYNGSDDDGDNIGDTPYYIDGVANSIDYYPLMEPKYVDPTSQEKDDDSFANDALQIIRILLVGFFILIGMIIIINYVRQNKSIK